ncbi:nuclear transport factor 2 family protein [Sphingobium subterraneum]|uniref:SnoaL-like domain-containing protein n=1 Tax=Sphingobium subterraneum TaxID=627688 RepID=A0A841J745_9SPHN|nr:nuclear transport factor 2 family protein [Sphingobium subterraneum]MBB6125356.1 hypothetical protein [Sphingobium subterraneum]
MRHEDITITMEELLDREKIRHNLARYSRGMDRQDADLIASTYWPDGWDDHGMIEASGRGFADSMKPMWPTLKMGHMLGQSCMEIDGNLANVETYFLAWHRMGEEPDLKDVFLGGRYEDRLEKRGEVWKFIHRVAVYDWATNPADSPPWDDSVFPFAAMPSRAYGETQDDYSWELFSKAPSRKGADYPKGKRGHLGV